MTSEDWALRADGVSVELGGIEIVHSADFRLDPGTITALVGPNGSGKTTLLRALARLVRPTTGRVSLPEADDITTLSARAFARRVGLLAQQRPTPAGITVHDIVEYGRHPHRSGWRGRDEQGAEAIALALELTGLAPLRDVALETLSGGQLQRAWFASALAQDTATLLLDEPTNHLDLRYQVEVLDLMRVLADDHGVAVGVVLHDLNHAADIADRVVVLKDGAIVASGTPDEALDPALLSDVYEIPVRVSRDESTGALDIRARRPRTPASSAVPATAGR